MKKRSLVIVLLALGLSGGGILIARCPPPHHQPTTTDAGAHDAGPVKTTVIVTNGTQVPTVVSVSFGSNSQILPASWPFCMPADSGAVACSFPLGAQLSQTLPLSGHYLNATLAFGSPNVGCGSTKAELNVNNPQPWYDIVDVSLVDGYNGKVQIQVVNPGDAGTVLLGPPKAESGNEKVFGLFPIGCDICVARQKPACLREPGKLGCKTGTQYNPDVPCQYQGPIMGGGSAIQVSLVP